MYPHSHVRSMHIIPRYVLLIALLQSDLPRHLVLHGVKFCTHHNKLETGKVHNLVAEPESCKRSGQTLVGAAPIQTVVVLN